MKEDFGKKLRIKSDKEFEEVLKEGGKTFGKNLTIVRLKADEGQKFGIRINRAIRGVKRNKIKRIIREILRKNKDKFGSNEKVVVLYRSEEIGVNYQKLLDEFHSLLK
jgi:ribonuclease P protein component